MTSETSSSKSKIKTEAAKTEVAKAETAKTEASKTEAGKAGERRGSGRVSSVRIRMEDMKHRLSVILISLFVFLMKDLCLYISIYNSRSSYKDPLKLKEDLQRIIRLFTEANVYHMLYLLPLAVILGVNSFHYLHNRQRVDFMHALPVSRGRLYRVIVSDEILIFLLPCILSLAIQTAMVGYLGLWTPAYLAMMIKGALSCLIAFLLSYLMMVFSMIITGQTLVSLLAYGVFLLYAPVWIEFLLEMYAQIFFRTYCSLPQIIKTILSDLSPLTVACQLMDKQTMQHYAIAGIWILCLYLAGKLAYRLRPSERSGMAMAFKPGQFLVKLMIVVPIAMAIGFTFYDVTLEENILWLYFGVAFGAILIHAIVEWIYHLDIRGLLAHKVQMLCILILSILCVMFFDVDPLKLEHFLPDRSQIDYLEIGEFTNGYWSGWDSSEDKADIIDQADQDKVLKELDAITEELDQTTENDDVVLVVYHLKNGIDIPQKYYMSSERSGELGDILYGIKAYKQEIYPVLTSKAEEISGVECRHPLGDSSWQVGQDLTVEETEEFLSLLQEEIGNQSYEEMCCSQPLAMVEITYLSQTAEEGETLSDSDINSYPIYPSYEKTIAFMKKHGAHVEATAADLNISRLYIEYNSSPEGADEASYENYTITDQKFIDSVKDKLYYADLSSVRTKNESLEEAGYITAQVGNTTLSFYTDAETLGQMIRKGKKD